MKGFMKQIMSRSCWLTSNDVYEMLRAYYGKGARIRKGTIIHYLRELELEGFLKSKMKDGRTKMYIRA